MQIVDLNSDYTPCEKCESNLAVLGTFTHTGIKEDTSRKKDELCQCNSCKKCFILRYSFFDPEGCINNFVFSGDINDPTYNWQDQLTEDQKTEIGKHLKECNVCNKRLVDEMANDAWLASLVHSLVKNEKLL